MLKKLLLLVTIFLIFSNTSAKAFNASDCQRVVNNGSSIQTAINASPGNEVICVREGTYNLFSGSNQNSLRIEKDNISLISHPDNTNKPVLKGPYHHSFPNLPYPFSQSSFNSLVQVRSKNVTVQGFDIKNSGGPCLSVIATSNVNIINNNTSICFRNGITVDNGSENVLVQGNDVSFTNMTQYWKKTMDEQGKPWAWGAAVRVRKQNKVSKKHNTNITFKNNVIHETFGEGMVIGIESDNVLVEGNIVYDTWALLYYRARGSNITFKNNIGFYTDNKTYWRGGHGGGGRPGSKGAKPGSGITFANEKNDNIPHGKKTYVYNNLLYNTGTGLSFWPQKDGSLDQAYFFYNTVIDSHTANVAFGDPCGIGDLVNRDCQWFNNKPVDHNALFTNNVILTSINGSAEANVGKSNGINFVNNVWSNQSLPEKVKSSSDKFVTNPQIFTVNLSSSTVTPSILKVLQLKPDFKGINSAAALTQTLQNLQHSNKDLYFCNRVETADIGAIEFNGTDCNRDINPPPPPPPEPDFDFNNDGLEDLKDVVLLIKEILGEGRIRFDADGNGVVDVKDAVTVLIDIF